MTIVNGNNYTIHVPDQMATAQDDYGRVINLTILLVVGIY